MVWKEVLARGTPPPIRWSLTEDLLEEGLGVLLGDLPGRQGCEALDGHILGECHCTLLGDVVLGQGLATSMVSIMARRDALASWHRRSC